MTNLIQSIRIAAARRAAYNRTVAEISTMPLDVALDLDIYRPDARRIAQQAIYGA